MPRTRVDGSSHGGGELKNWRVFFFFFFFLGVGTYGRRGSWLGESVPVNWVPDMNLVCLSIPKKEEKTSMDAIDRVPPNV